MRKSVKLELSEFNATTDLSLHYKDNKACGSVVEGCIGIKIKKGEKIPEIYVRQLALNNPELIDIKREHSILQLTKAQQKKYDLDIAKVISEKKAKEPKTEKEVIDRLYPKWNMENLNKKLAYYIKKYKKEGNTRFKNWCEKEFGEEKIDKRKSVDNIMVKILKLQSEGKL